MARVVFDCQMTCLFAKKGQTGACRARFRTARRGPAGGREQGSVGTLRHVNHVLRWPVKLERLQLNDSWFGRAPSVSAFDFLATPATLSQASVRKGDRHRAAVRRKSTQHQRAISGKKRPEFHSGRYKRRTRPSKWQRATAMSAGSLQHLASLEDQLKRLQEMYDWEKSQRLSLQGSQINEAATRKMLRNARSEVIKLKWRGDLQEAVANHILACMGSKEYGPA